VASAPEAPGELFLDDAGIPDRVEAVRTRTALPDEVASPIVREGHVEWLVDIVHPVREELERGELGRVVVGSPQDIQVGRNRGEKALRHRRALGDSDRVDRAPHVDEVLFRALPRMVRPCAGVGEGVERGVQGDQSGDFVAGLIVEFLEGDLADDLVTEIAPRPRWRRVHHASEQEEKPNGHWEKSLTESGGSTLAHDVPPVWSERKTGACIKIATVYRGETSSISGAPIF